jgi:hypothetical protein
MGAAKHSPLTFHHLPQAHLAIARKAALATSDNDLPPFEKKLDILWTV